MENFEYIEELIKNKDYNALSASERAIVDTVLDEEAYNNLRSGVSAVSGERLALSRDRKKELLTSWKSERKGIAAWLVKPLPAYSYLVVFLLFGILYWLLPPKVVTEKRISELSGVQLKLLR